MFSHAYASEVYQVVRTLNLLVQQNIICTWQALFQSWSNPLNLLRILLAPWVATRVVATARNRVALLGENPRNEPQVLRIELRWMVLYHLCKPFPSCQRMTFSPPRKGIPICNLQKPLPFDKMPPQTLLRCPSCSPRTKILQSWPKQRQRWSVSGPKSHGHFRSPSRGYARKGGARIKQWKWLLHKWMQSDMYRLRLVVTDIISDIFSCIPPCVYHVHEGAKVSWFDLRFDSGRPSLSQREAKSGKSIGIIGREWKEASTLPPRYTKKERSPTVESNKQYYSTIYVLFFLMPDAGTHDHEASGNFLRYASSRN